MKKGLFLLLGLCVMALSHVSKADDYAKCESNKDCAINQFCEGGDKNCSFVRNKCLPLGRGEQKTYKGKTYLISLSKMGWWAAKNWCEANGMSLVKLETLSLKAPAEHCHHTECLNNAGENMSKHDWKELRDSIGREWFWVDDLHETCDSFRVAPLLELLAYSRRPVNLRALCE